MTPVNLTVPEVAARLRVCRATVYTLCRDGELSWIKQPRGRRLIPLASVIEYERRHTVEQPAERGVRRVRAYVPTVLVGRRR